MKPKKLTLEQYDYLRGNEFIMDQGKNFIAYFEGPKIQIYNINTGGKLIISIRLPIIITNHGRENGLVLAWLDK